MTQHNTQNGPPQQSDTNALVLTLEQKIERSREYLDYSKKIQDEINSVYEKLILGFEMNLEGKLQRLSLERDEVLLSLGKSIFSLAQNGIELKFEKKEKDKPPVETESQPKTISGFEGAKVIKYPTNYQTLSPISQISQSLPNPQTSTVSPSTTPVPPQVETPNPIIPTPIPTPPPHPLSYTQQLQSTVVNTEAASITIQQNTQSVSQSSGGNGYYQQKTYSQQSYYQQNNYQRYPREYHKDRYNHHQNYQNHGFQNTQIPNENEHSQEKSSNVDYLEKQAILEKIKDVKLSLNGWPDSTFNTEPFNQNHSIQLKKILDKLGMPKNYTQEEQKQQILFIEEEIDCSHNWSPWPRELQKNILTLIASRLRTLQKEDFSDPFDHNERYAKLFRKLTRFSSDHRPGFVQALSKDKSPVNSDWLQDELEAWNWLNDWLNQSKD
jgi:hypothetical protein